MHMPRKYASHPYWSWHGHQDGCRRRPAVAQPRFCHWTASQAISPPAHVTSGVGGGHHRRHGRCALSPDSASRNATCQARHAHVTLPQQRRHPLFALPPVHTHEHATAHRQVTSHAAALLHHTALPQLLAVLAIAPSLAGRGNGRAVTG